MAIVYCSWATGNDSTGTGTAANPYKTITKASTSRTAGDEVRVAKSPDPTALTGTTAWTLNGTTVTGTGTLFTTELVIGDFISAPDGNWYEVITLTSDTSATLYKKYPSATASGHSSQKLGVIDQVGANYGTVDTVASSGNATDYLYISGGWDLSTESQTGQTWYRQMNATFNNRYGYALKITQKYVYISRIHFLRYQIGYSLSGNPSFLVQWNVLDTVTCNSNSSEGIACSSYGAFNKIISPTCNSNSSGVLLYSGDILISPTCNSNGTGIGQYGGNSTITNPTCNSNTTAISVGVSVDVHGKFTAKNNDNLAGATSSILTVEKLDFQNNTNINSITHEAAAYSIRFTDLNGYSYIYERFANAISQDATAGGSGKEWKLSVTNANINSGIPFYIPIAKVAVGSSGKVTVKVYFKKSGTGIAGALRCRYGQITWSDAAQDIIVTCPDNTSRNQVTLEFTPTEAGVVEIEAGAWYVSAVDQNIIIDDITITQA